MTHTTAGRAQREGGENMKISSMIESLKVMLEQEGDLELNINIHGDGTKTFDVENGKLVIENYGK